MQERKQQRQKKVPQPAHTERSTSERSYDVRSRMYVELAKKMPPQNHFS